MKSCQCAQCNVSSARFAWGFTLLARDGWELSTDLVSAGHGAWLCPTCRERSEAAARPVVKAQGSKPVGNSRKRPWARLRVLLIDDDELLRRCIQRQLGEFEVVTARSALEALGILEQDTDFDVVLSDVMMPGMSGVQLYAACYRRFPTLAPRFVFASGNPEVARAELGRAVEALGVPQEPILLAKPSSREALLLALFAAAAHGTSRSGTYSVVEPGQVGVKKYRG